MVEKQKTQAWIICFLLGVITCGLFWPITHHGFVNFDDQQYITRNTHVTTGLHWSNVIWALHSGYASNWHPLTWISHMLDCQFYGLNPGGHHFTNILIHAANSVLLFLLLLQMTGGLWRSAFVAAFFAWHPLHVESVAWAAERKDTLSAFFWILTMMAYASYVKKPGFLKYSLALLLFLSGLMSKSMLVTLPFVLLLMDFWPLKRFSFHGSPLRMTSSSVESETAVKIAAKLIGEKIPFLVLAAGTSLITYFIQKNDGVVWTTLTLPMRLANALVAYVSYISKLFWPVDLAILYPYYHHWSAWLVGGAGFFLALWTALVIFRIKPQPYLAVGWFWFLGTLIPVIGIVQVGAQSMADRYTYIPSIGFFISVVWGLGDLFGNSLNRGRILAGVGGLALAGCLLGTWQQIKFWQNSETLFLHAVKVVPDNYLALDYLGYALNEDGKQSEALQCYAEAVQIGPEDEQLQNDYGTILMQTGQLKKAVEHLRLAVKIRPDYEKAQLNLGASLSRLGDANEAAQHLIQAVSLQPDDPAARYNYGTFLLSQRLYAEAESQLAKALELKPDYYDVLGNIAVACLNLGQTNQALGYFSRAVQLNATDASARVNFGLALSQQNQPGLALQQFNAAARLDPANPMIHYLMGTVLTRLDQTAEAIAEYRRALSLNPNFPDALNNLAWILCTDANPAVRSGPEAVKLAAQACELTKNDQPGLLLTLAAAYAETGQFSKAIATAQKAGEMASAAGQTDLIHQAGQCLKSFQAGQPFRETR